MGRSQPPAGAIGIGISGWRYEGWRGVFFTGGPGPEARARVRIACLPHDRDQRLLLLAPDAAELRELVPSTRGRASIFGVKGGRYITHIRRLREIEKPLANFFASGVLNLREKLGPFLWQFPAVFAVRRGAVRAFFELLPQDAGQALALARRRDARMNGRSRLAIDRNRAMRHAVEIRNDTFASAAFVRQLRRHKIALVVADTAGGTASRT